MLALTALVTRNHVLHLMRTVWTIPTLILCLDTGAGSFGRRVSGMPKSQLAFESQIPIHKVIQQEHEKPCQNTTSYLSITIKNTSMTWTAALYLPITKSVTYNYAATGWDYNNPINWAVEFSYALGCIVCVESNVNLISLIWSTTDTHGVM